MSRAKLRRRACAGVLGAVCAVILAGAAASQSLFGTWMDRDRAVSVGAAPQVERPRGAPDGDDLPAPLRRQFVLYPTNQPAGTIIIDTAHTFLYLTLGHGKALRYGIGVGRKGFTWSGVERISRKSEWPDWTPPPEMIARQPYLPRWVGGGPGNPLGARALYLGNTDYRIHGTNNPASIGTQVSSGCIRMRDADVIDLYDRVAIGTKVIVLANDQRNVVIDEYDDDRQNVAIERGPSRGVTGDANTASPRTARSTTARSTTAGSTIAGPERAGAKSAATHTAAAVSDGSMMARIPVAPAAVGTGPAGDVSSTDPASLTLHQIPD
jgi:lipoprotein-anchoring transpeptidase ErfK/SrfK